MFNIILLTISTIRCIMALQPFAVPWLLSQFLHLNTVGRTPWTGDRPVARPLPTHRTTQTRNKRTQTSGPRVEFKPATLVFQRAKMVRALYSAATVIGTNMDTKALRLLISPTVNQKQNDPLVSSTCR
jgi:hypothetical protein